MVLPSPPTEDGRAATSRARLATPIVGVPPVNPAHTSPAIASSALRFVPPLSLGQPWVRLLVWVGLLSGLIGALSLLPGCSDGSGGDGGSGGSGAGDGITGGSGAGSGSSGGGAAGGSSGTGAGAGAGASAGSGGAEGDRTACKRGVAYGHHSVADLAALSSGVSWWYNWAFTPDEALAGGAYRDEGVEYVPMIWGAGSDVEAAAEDIPQGALTLLGFNEPNFGEQANLSAAEAAALWPELEELAEARDLALVSPAVNFCGGNCQDTDPFGYLDDFFAACTGCRVDAIAIHIYVGCNAGGENHAEWLINHVETYKTRFSLPIWLTEFACDDATSLDVQQGFLEDAVEYLEAEPRIARYAWFAGRADNVPYVDLLGEDGQLTSLGQAYVDAPQPDECKR